MRIAITGFPKSGNTWVSRLLGDVLDSPVGGIKNAKPLATEGQERTGRYRVLQLHLRPVYEDVGMCLPNGWGLCVPQYDGMPLIHVVRDPRDVVVSAKHYWDIDTMENALEAVGRGLEPVKAVGPWQTYVTNWLDCPVKPLLVRYEDLHTDAASELVRILEHWDLRYREDRIAPAVERQAFDAKRAQIQSDGDGRIYGKSIQLKNLRRGKVGGWRRCFTTEMNARAREFFGETAGRLGYELS